MPTPHVSRRDFIIGVGPGRFWQWVNQAAKDAELKAWPHLLRHTTATRLYERTKDPLLVKDFLGHADLSQIPRYVPTSDARMELAVEEL